MPTLCIMRRLSGAAMILWLGCTVFSAEASAVPTLCEQAIRAVSGQSGVPERVLRAIALTESGRNVDGAMRPWPWAVNVAGTGRYFETEAEAVTHLRGAYLGGERNFDVGCFQLNFRWHGQAFGSIQAMFDPMSNASYAADLLARHFRKTGDWILAAGRYHSGTPDIAARYRARFQRMLAMLPPDPGPPLPAEPGPTDPPRATAAAGPGQTRARVNAYPLLISAGSGAPMGSLVPLHERGATARHLFARD